MKNGLLSLIFAVGCNSVEPVKTEECSTEEPIEQISVKAPEISEDSYTTPATGNIRYPLVSTADSDELNLEKAKKSRDIAAYVIANGNEVINRQNTYLKRQQVKQRLVIGGVKYTILVSNHDKTVKPERNEDRRDTVSIWTKMNGNDVVTYDTGLDGHCNFWLETKNEITVDSYWDILPNSSESDAQEKCNKVLDAILREYKK